MHKHMALDIDECIESTHIKNKVTAVIPTWKSPIEFLMWTVFSLLLRSTPNLFEHFIVCIDGADKRTGDPSLQDQKQAFLEDIRKLKWQGKDMPITVIRAWSRIGHAETIEMAMPWVHTDAYLLLHDDVIINDCWQEEVKEKFYGDNEVAIAYGSPQLLFTHCDHVISHGLYMIRLPHMYNHFLVCRKSMIRKSGAWWNNFILGSIDNPIQFDLEEEVEDLDGFLNYYRDKGILEDGLQTDEMYNFCHMGVGSWIFYKVNEMGYKIVSLEPDVLATHFVGMSYVNRDEANKRIEGKQEFVDELEEQIKSVPEYEAVYRKHKEK